MRTPEYPESEWLDRVRNAVLRGDFTRAEKSLAAALTGYPASFELRRVLAVVYRQTHRNAQAEALLRGLLVERPNDAGLAFTLARLFVDQGRTQAAARVITDCFQNGGHDTNLAIQAIEFLDDCDRKYDAAAIAALALSANPEDPRLHAYAGLLANQTGDFDAARRHYLYTLDHSAKACEWHAPYGLVNAQRYRDPRHPDFARLAGCLQRNDLSNSARATLLFSLGKAYDDIGGYLHAAQYFREANAIAQAQTLWSRKEWRRAVEAQLASKPLARLATAADDFVPIFIVGMPRSGTTLLAELLSRHTRVCNRGELPWIAKFAQRADMNGTPSTEALTRAAVDYAAQARRDDAPEARWFIDKQPLNFRYINLMRALFPGAKIIHCDRSARDNALSLWMQSFVEDVQGYAYDFANIATVMRDCARLMAHWRTLFPDSIRTIRYEQLVANPLHGLERLNEWLQLPALDAPDRLSASINTASLWQARQPVYTRSVQRWRNYAEYVPELMAFIDD